MVFYEMSFLAPAPAEEAGPPAPESDDVNGGGNVHAAEKPKVGCPQCVTTGVVDVLRDICRKQGMACLQCFRSLPSVGIQ